jgi:PhnB protein
MQIVPYLNFDGTCAEAFRRYAEILGGELSIQTHGESPIAGEVPESWHGRVLHARLDIGDHLLMASDTPPDYDQPPAGFSVSLQIPDPAEAERIFAALAEGGEMRMEMQETFWAKRFGMCMDRWGIPWMVNCLQGA